LNLKIQIPTGHINGLSLAGQDRLSLTSSKHICSDKREKDAKSPKAPNTPHDPRARLTAIPKNPLIQTR